MAAYVGIASILVGSLANRPSAAQHPDAIYVAEDDNTIARSVGGAWQAVGPATAAVAWAAITGKPATFPPDPHSHSYGSLTGTPDLSALPTTGQKNALAGSQGTPGTGNEFLTKQDPSRTDARTPLAHAHPQSDVTGLVAALAAKQDASTAATDSELTTGLAGKANTSHAHAQSDVTGLAAALAAKADTTDARFTDQRVASVYPWTDLLDVGMPLASASVAGTYLGHNQATVGVTAATALSGQLVSSFRFDPADYPAITGKTLQFRVVGSLLGNNTDPGTLSFTFGLYVVTGTGATTTFTVGLGAASIPLRGVEMCSTNEPHPSPAAPRGDKNPALSGNRDSRGDRKPRETPLLERLYDRLTTYGRATSRTTRRGQIRAGRSDEVSGGVDRSGALGAADPFKTSGRSSGRIAGGAAREVQQAQDPPSEPLRGGACAAVEGPQPADERAARLRLGGESAAASKHQEAEESVSPGVDVLNSGTGVSVPIQALYDLSEDPCVARYRTRTRVRSHLPWVLTWLAPKGSEDCGDHDWYRHDDTTAYCYHCEVGERPLEPDDVITPDGDVVKADVLDPHDPYDPHGSFRVLA